MSSDDDTEQTLPSTGPSSEPSSDPSSGSSSIPSQTHTLAASAKPSTENDPLVGTEFVGKYRINKTLGRGGMGAVYLAEHLLMRRQVAIKVLLTRMLDDDSSRKRFEHEARIASQLSHPNAVTLYDFGIEADLPYLVMEYAEGSTLKALLKAEGALSVERTVGLLSQLEGALSQAHRMGIVHRDLKPDNIILTRSDTGDEIAKILDFGISKAIQVPGTESSEDADLTQTGMVLGTPRYLSPEQARGEAIDQRTDIYSLGIMTYEMLSGKAPFSQGTVLEVIAQHLHTEPPKLSEVKKSISPEVTAVVATALSKDPEQRPPTVTAYVESLRKASAKKSRSLLFGLVALVLAGVGVFLFDAYRLNGSDIVANAPSGAPSGIEGYTEVVAEPEEAASVVAESEVSSQSLPETAEVAQTEQKREAVAEEKVEVAKAKEALAEANLKLAEENEKLVETEAKSIPQEELSPLRSPTPSPSKTASPEESSVEEALPSPVASSEDRDASNSLATTQKRSEQETPPMVSSSRQPKSIPTGFYIELKAVKTEAEAKALVKMYQGTKFRAHYEETTALGKTRYQVLVGTFSSMFSAMGEAKAVAKISGISSKITTVKQK